jgi:leucyl/phenylalanyl-tRNA--protein transferase
MALAARLRDWGFPLLDAQVANPHLLSLGARRIPRADFLTRVRELGALPAGENAWRDGAPRPLREFLETCARSPDAMHGVP